MRDDLDMRREQELIDRGDARDAVAAIDQDAEVAGKRAWIQDTATTFATSDWTSVPACAAAPARGGSNTTAS